MTKLEEYINFFNENDNEIYKNDVENNRVYDWIKNEIPLFECPDKEIEQTYYFRWWTYRKHIKRADDGYAISEFLPDVPWSDAFNIINAAAGHHLAEGRWLRNGKKYLSHYIDLLLTEDGRVETHKYSSWLIASIKNCFDVIGYDLLDDSLLDKMVKYYETWESSHLLPNGMFWSVDDRDAMEYMISGTDENLVMMKGIRPTLNSYLCADAYAISELAEKLGKTALAHKYKDKGDSLSALINERLWDGEIYKAFHYYDDNYQTAFEPKHIPIEEIGYIPWMFKIPPKGREDVFNYLQDDKIFKAPTGITTADMREKRFMFEVKHECLWNGYVWPFATSQTLTALINVINYYGRSDFAESFIDLMHVYSASHTMILDDGSKIPWIDEMLHPFEQKWVTPIYIKQLGLQTVAGPKLRGKDYNHSTFCDLVISGICGAKCADGKLSVKPIISEKWDYFSLKGLYFDDAKYDIYFDRKGDVYNKGAGLKIYKNDREFV